MTLLRCSTCSRHIKTEQCPFCGGHAARLRARAPGKGGIAMAAGVAAMGLGLGCAYGLPPDYYERDASKPDVSVSDGSKDAPQDAPVDAKVDAGSDVGVEAGTGDAALDAQDGGG